MAKAKNHHRVQWEILKGGYVNGEIVCNAPAGAFCRLACPEGCETWPCEHRFEDQGYCNAVEWISNSDPQDAYDGADHALESGPVIVEWDARHECYVWCYPDDPSVVEQGT